MLAGPDFLVLDRFEYKSRGADYKYRGADYKYRGADYKYRGADYKYRDADYKYQKKHEPCGASKSPPVPS